MSENKDKSIENELQEVIKKNLPQQVGEQLQSELRELALLRTVVKTQKLRMDELSKENVRLTNLEIKESFITEREIAVVKKEQALLVNEAIHGVKSECLIQRNNDIFNLVSNLTKNTTFRKNIYENMSEDGYSDQSGQWVQGKNNSKNTTEITEKD